MTRNRPAQNIVGDLDNEDRVRVLQVIDQFRSFGINEDISLPQLVVVGDQSSGKSSLLEGLTGLSFPIASELCTRFATQIVLRRSNDGSQATRVSILPGPSSSNDEEQRARLEGFSREVQDDGLDQANFAHILNEAAICMGLPSIHETNFENMTKRFSDDVLKIELSGPDHHHLSVVDVPGLFHNPTKFQTQEDLDIIRRLLEGYVRDRRTIILAVMDARNNLANQEVFSMARAADPQGRRTVGIITKCDALEDGDEQSVLNIASNKVEKLTHGWFAVKNRSTKDIQNGVTLAQRNQNETIFFDSSLWKSLPRDRVGIAALKKFLGKLLYDHIRGEYPALVAEIRSLVERTREELDALGRPRQTTVQQRQYLSEIASRYQHLVNECLRGGYDPEWEANDCRKLRMHLHLLNEEFNARMHREGHDKPFCNANNEVDEAYASLHGPESILDWIRRVYRDSRGSELPGTVNPTVLENLFRQQAKNWKTIAVAYLNAVDMCVQAYNRDAWKDVVFDEGIRQKIETRNDVVHRATISRAVDQLTALIKVETSGILQTVNHYFADNVQAARSDRVLIRLRSLGLSNDDSNWFKLDEIMSAAHLSNEDQAVYDIHDTLKAYYQVALKRFADNIVLQCVECCYVGIEGPVRHISPALIGELTDDELHTIAAEDYSTSLTRTEITQKLTRLEKALALAEKERM